MRVLAISSLYPQNEPLSYDWLVKVRRRSLRNGGWVKLSSTKKALIRCALWVAKTRGHISNTRLMTQVLTIAYQLLESIQSRIEAAGKKRALLMLCTYNEPGGVFSWAPHVREWLSDSNYISYLGVGAQS